MCINIYESDILKRLYGNQYSNQRIIAKEIGCSLGTVNQSLNNLIRKGYLNKGISLTGRAYKEIEEKSPKSAIILAAGFGMRMVPINLETPKGLLEVNNEPLIERLIKQLHEVNIKKIYIVVGFMKECYEYLIDEYDVELIVNTEYSTKNNLYSLKMAVNYLDNSYILPCDIWCKKNPFSRAELYSWYMVGDKGSKGSNVRVNRKKELMVVGEREKGNKMLGIAYLQGKEADFVKNRLVEICSSDDYEDLFWEETLVDSKKMIVSAKTVSLDDYIEINTYEQLRNLDEKSTQLKSLAIELAAKAFNEQESEIINITVLKKGMTNRSFMFQCKEKNYIMRIPGEGTDLLIDRKQEANVYAAVKDQNICDNVVYMNSINGYKITEYIKNARVCNPKSQSDITKCMRVLKDFHNLNLEVDHEFDIFKQIEFYESLWAEKKSIYKDYQKTKEKVLSLKAYIDRQPKKRVLTHIDAVPDNFLFYVNEEGREEIRLIDWEYAGMQDPHVDIAMFCIYSLYDKAEIDRLIDIYFSEGCVPELRIKIYCYIAVCGLLWSNWCEYKRSLGVEFGEYSYKQYRYAKEYYKIVQQELLDLKERENE